MSIYSDNLRTMEKNKPQLSAVISAAVQAGFTEDFKCGSELIEDRRVLYALTGEELWQLSSMYENKGLAEQWRQAAGINANAKAYMFGLGDGSLALEALKGMGESGRLFIYEPSFSLLQQALGDFDLQELLADGRVTIFTPLHESAGIELFKALGHSVDYADIPNIRQVFHPNYDLLFPKAYAYFKDRVAEIITSMESNRSVYERFGEYFAINGLYNVPYIKESRDTSDLAKRLPGDYTAIIVSAGPSLTKNVELLKRAKGKALIIAADSALKPLFLKDIYPDIFVSVDANKSPKHFDDDRIKKIPIVADFSTCRGALQGHGGPYFFARTENPHLLKFFLDRDIDIPKLGSGGSVANTAFSFAEKLGIKRIVLIGQDLAYTDNKSHADGATRASWGLDLDHNSVMVEGQKGEMVKSSGEFIHYRNWFERSIATCQDIQVINATEGGARIHGSIEMPLQQVIDTYIHEDFDIESAIRESSYLLSEGERQDFEGYMAAVSGQLLDLSDNLRSGVRIYEEMLSMVYEGKYLNPRFKKLYEKTSAITGETEQSPVLYYAECMVQKEMTELLKNSSDIKQEERQELIAAIGEGKKRFELLYEGCRRIEKAMKES